MGAVRRQGKGRSERRINPAKSRVKALACSGDLATLLGPDHDRSACDQQVSQAWACQTCTFLNHAIMSSCEMCYARKGAPSFSPQLLHRRSDAYDLTAEWPQLPDVRDSGVQDGASSVGSSWLDVCGSADCDTDGTEANFVYAASVGVEQDSTDKRQHSWASRVGI